MDLTEGSETSANINLTLGKHPQVNTVNFNTYLELAFFVDQILKKFHYEDQTPANSNKV
jgi:hypothetical protein